MRDNQRQLTRTGKKIKKKLIDEGMSQVEFCELYGIPKNQLCDLIHGKQMPKLQARVCDLLGISA